MIRMIIADDEPVITRGIKKLVNWQSLGIDIIGDYADGKKALDGILTHKPDVALLDIAMPGRNGIDILKECKSLGVKTQIIFISGFQDFEYAKAALHYGAVDYLLKPVLREELLNSIEKCMTSIPGSPKEMFLSDGESEPEVDYGKLIEPERCFYTPVYAEVLYQTEEDPQLRKLVNFSLISFLEEYLSEKMIGITFLKKEHIVIVIKSTDSDKEKCLRLVEEISHQAKEAAGHQIAFIIGLQVANMREIPNAFEQCLAMKGYLFFADQLPNAIVRTHEPVFHEVQADRFGEVREKLLDAVIGLNLAEFERYYSQFGKLVCRMADGKKEDACFYFCTAIRHLDEKIVTMGISGCNPEMKDLLEKGRKCICYSEMLVCYYKVYRDYLEHVQQTIASSDKQNIIKAKDYIEKHYKEDLTLGILAAEVHMNPYYFSSFFKKSAGENFKDYVNKVRIQHGISCLISTNMKVTEIAHEIGFHDARAFTEIFQRLYHETPGAYRKRVRMGSL